MPPTTAPKTDADLSAYCTALAEAAVVAGRALAATSGQARAYALEKVADALLDRASAIVDANAKDLAAADLADAMVDRLTLNDARIAKMADSVRQIAGQVDPIGQVIQGYVRPNGLRLEKVRAPIGVVLIIYESRPNVTSDAAALCLKSGNAVILRGGKESIHTNGVVADVIRDALGAAGIPRDTVQLVSSTDRTAVGHLLKLEGMIDLAIPRGGESLIRAVVEQAHIPVIKHYSGNCQIYIDADCDDAMATKICVNAKSQRPGVCNAAETLLFHREAADRGLLAKTCTALAAEGVEVRGDTTTCSLFPEATPATDADWATEYLDRICAVTVVEDLDSAIEHITRHGSKHTDAIITNSVAAADKFIQRVDSANVFVNCSTRFSDGGEYGLGAEIGISTDKLHARGPMGAEDLTTYKWVVRGDGQVRE